MCVLELYAGRMYTLLLVIVCVINCCITGDDGKLAQVFPQDNNQKQDALELPQEDRPSIV